MAQDQRVEFLFAAQVSGQAELKKLTDAVDSLRKEMEALKAANGGTGAAMQQFSRSIGNASSHVQAYQKHLDAQAKAMRNHRQGTQQLGMQFNDLGTSISTGASPIQAFNQQLGQMGYALSMMEGKAGKLGDFLAGPWGAAVVIATMALGPLIEAFFNTSKAAEELQKTEEAGRKSSINLLEAKAELDKALGRNTQNYKLAKQAAFDSALGDLAAANAAVTASQIRVAVAQKEKRIVKSIQESEGGAIGGFLLGAFGFGNVDAAVKESNEKINAYKNAQGALLKARAQLVNANKTSSSTEEVSSRNVSGANRAAEKVKKLKPEFSMKGFYEEFFAKEFEKSDESLAKVAETQIKALVDTIPDLAKVSDEMVAIQTRNDELNNSFQAIGMTVSDAFKGMLTGAMSWKDGMRSLISSVIDQLWKLFVVQKIVGLVSGALGGATGTPSSGGSFGSSTGNFLPGVPKFAKGTTYAPGGMALVGERGPELVNLPKGSQVIPNHKIGGGGGSPINISVDARGSNDPAAVRAQVQQGILEAAPAIIAAAEARTIAGLRRPRLGGVMQ